MKQIAFCRTIEPCLLASLRKRLTRKASAEDFMLRYVGYLDASNVSSWLNREISLVQASQPFINLAGEDTGVAQSVKGKVESSEAREQVNKSHPAISKC